MKKLLIIIFILCFILIGIAQDNWISPTGHDSNDWDAPQNAYDGDTDTRASILVNSRAWSPYLPLTFNEIDCDKVRIWPHAGSVDLNKINVDYWDGSNWISFYEGSFTTGQWNEFSIGSTKKISKIRITFYNSSLTTNFSAYVYEAMVNDVTPTGWGGKFNTVSIGKWNTVEIKAWNGVE